MWFIWKGSVFLAARLVPILLDPFFCGEQERNSGEKPTASSLPQAILQQSYTCMEYQLCCMFFYLTVYLLVWWFDPQAKSSKLKCKKKTVCMAAWNHSVMGIRHIPSGFSCYSYTLEGCFMLGLGMARNRSAVVMCNKQIKSSGICRFSFKQRSCTTELWRQCCWRWAIICPVDELDH